MIIESTSKDQRTSFDEAILKALKALNEHGGLNVSQLAKLTDLHWKTADKALTLLIKISTNLEGKGIDTYDGGSSKMYIISDRVGIEQYPPELRNMIIKSEFPEATEEQRVLATLLLKGATCTRMSIQLDVKESLLNKLLDKQRIKITKDGRIFLTEIGLKIGRGTLMTYPEIMQIV